MQHVDALRRYLVTIITSDTLTARLQRAQQEDENIQNLKSLIGTNNATDFFIKNEILYKYVDGRELIAAPRDMQTELIKLAHEKGHFSSAKTEEILTKRCRKKEGFLNPIPKEDVPLSTYHVDFIGPLPSTNKRYQHILTIIDAFTKFTWLYPVKSTTLEDITTGVPRGNGQVERIHRTLIPVLTKLSIDDPTKWYKFVDRLQRILNSTSNRSTKWSPFELLTGVTMRNREDLYLRNLLMEEMVEELQERRNQLRQDAKRNIQKIQAENKRTYDRKRKKAPRYQKGDLVAIQRTQFGSGLKLRPKFLGPYKVIEVKPRDRYNLERVGNHEGPKLTSSADLMKFYSPG
ncbi:transposon Tf2-6 polyprotein [Trichonephila clavipes]|nr:transposon Tf2-6 polyprotein [Trichonephila clavipes]